MKKENILGLKEYNFIQTSDDLNVVINFLTLVDRNLGKKFLEYFNKEVGKFGMSLSMEKCMFYSLDITGFNSRCYNV